MPKLKLDRCAIHVSDWQRSNAYCGNVMGAEVTRRGNGWVYRLGAMQLNCHGPGLDPTPVARLSIAPGNGDLCFEWPGPIAQAKAHLEAHGVAVEVGRVKRADARGDGVSIYFRDPDGSLLEFISYVPQVSRAQRPWQRASA